MRTDADDNKFADMYVTCGAKVLVSNDTQLLALNKLEFPPFTV